MQLNSLSLNSYRPYRQLDLKLAIYEHKLARIHQEIFIFGKSFSQFQTQTSLYKLNTLYFTLENIHISNAPSFEQFIMFNFHQILYFWGKNRLKSLNQLYSFDGSKFTQINQNGPIPDISLAFTHCIFSENFLLVFGYILKQQYFGSWFVLNLMTNTWKQAKCDYPIPFSQKSSLIWINGKGYLLMTNVFDKKSKQLKNNCLYEITIKSFSQLILKCQKILIDQKNFEQNIVFQHIFSFSSNQLMIMGNQQLPFQRNSQQDKIQQTYQILNLQTFKWSQTILKVKIKGQYSQIFCYQNILIFVGGIYNEKLVESIQILNYVNSQQNFVQKNLYPKIIQQSRCYNCQQAFTYTQKLIYEPFINKIYENFLMKNKIQMKFLKKLSQQFISQFQAIGILIDYFRFNKCRDAQISFKEQISHTKQFHNLRSSIEKQPANVLGLQGLCQKAISLASLQSIFSYQQKDRLQGQPNAYIQFFRLILASLKIGTGLLFVALTEQNKIFVGYVSCSSSQFPEINIKSFSKIYYTISLDLKTQQNRYSSKLNRSIIFENVSLYFGNPQSYEKNIFFEKIIKKRFIQYPLSLFVVGISNLQKIIKNQEFSPLINEDIVLKNRKKTQSMNSLQKYLRHLYLNQYLAIKIQSSLLASKNIFQVFQNLQKNRFIKLITVRQEKVNKHQLDQTHFSTSHEQVIHWKKIDDVQKCILYSINSNKIKKFNIYYQGIFVYHLKRLIKIINLKNKIICGIVQISSNTQIRLNKANFSQKAQQRKLKKWLQQIQQSLVSLNANIQV